MSEAKQKEKNQTRLKKFIVAIIPVGITALIAAIVFLVLVFSGKNGGDSRKKPQGNTVWRVSEATHTKDFGFWVRKYQYTYDGKGREIRRDIQETVKGEKSTPVTLETAYYPGGCGIYWDDSSRGYQGYVEKYFFVTNPIINAWKEPIDRFEVDESGRLTQVICKEVRYSINTWLFDSEGRPIKLWNNDSDPSYGYVETYQYDDMGRILRITLSGKYDDSFRDIVYGEGEKRIVRHTGVDGYIICEEELDGQRLIRETYYDEGGNVTEERKYYFPNGNFPSLDMTSEDVGRHTSETYFAFESVWSGETQDWEKKVELAPDGQPLRELDMSSMDCLEYVYDKNGMLCESFLKTSDGDITNHYSYEFDKHGNLIRYSLGTLNGYRYVWQEVEID